MWLPKPNMAYSSPIPMDHALSTIQNLQRIEHEQVQYRQQLDRKWTAKLKHGSDVIQQRYDDMHRFQQNRLMRLWLPQVAAAARANMFVWVIKNRQDWKQHMGRKIVAAKVIQKNFRVLWLEVKLRRRVMRGLKALASIINAGMAWRRVRRQQKATQVLLLFTQEVQQRSMFQMRISYFRGRILRLQRWWRSNRRWAQCVVYVWSCQLEAYEADILAAHTEKAERLRVNYKHSAMCQKDIVKQAGFNIYEEPEKIEDHRRISLLENYFFDHRRVIAAALKEYFATMEVWKVVYRQALIMDEGRRQVTGDPVCSDQSEVEQALKRRPVRPCIMRKLPAPLLAELLGKARKLQEQAEKELLQKQLKRHLEEAQKQKEEEEALAAKKNKPREFKFR